MTPIFSDSPVRVLVVEDDPQFPEYLRLMLRAARTRFEIAVVRTVRGALRELATDAHDVCLLDYRLNDEDGLDVLRGAQKRGVRTPIVLLTGEGSESLELLAIEQGAADYLDKSEIDPRRLERALCRAITRHRADTALHQRETQLADAERAALVMVTEVGLDGRWLRVPPRFCEMLDYTEEELLALRWLDVTYPDDVAADERCRRELFNGTARSTELEKRYLRKDGTVVWAYVNCSLVLGAQGSPPFYLAYVRDIGDQKRAEQALAASEQRYRMMVRNAPYGIFEAAQDGRFLAVNPALVAMLGFESEQEVLPLDPAALFVSADERARLLDPLAASEGTETHWRRRDGSAILVRVTAHAAGGVERVLHGVVEDVTERKRLEEQLRQSQKMEAIGQLAGGVAHDFNNLLTAILGYTDLLVERCQHDAELRADLDEIKSAGTSAAALTEQLLAFSRKQVLKPEVLSVNGVIENMRKLLPRVLGEDIELTTSLAADAPRVEADPVQLQQVVLNLAVNARDAMPLGGRLAIDTRALGAGHPDTPPTAIPGRFVVLTVADTGCGMDAATQARIFEPFFTTKAPGKGTGLGLATVYGIIKQSGGEIVCSTQPGAGTRFSIFLPATTKGAGPVTDAARGALAGGTETVLLVEDQTAVRRLTRRILEAHGYHVVDTGDTDAAVRLATSSRFDLLLSDVVMPQMSGPELARRVLTHAPDTRVLFMSGFAGHSALSELGGAPLLDKPFSPSVLVSKLREVLSSPECGRAAGA